MAKTIIGLAEFIEVVILPDGYHFKEWTPGNIVAPVPSQPGKPGNTFYDSVMAAIQRPDGKYAPFEISYLIPGPKRGLVYLSAAELSQAVDKAIEQLEAA